MNLDATWFVPDPELSSLLRLGAVLIVGAAVSAWLSTAVCLACMCLGVRRPARRHTASDCGSLAGSPWSALTEK